MVNSVEERNEEGSQKEADLEVGLKLVAEAVSSSVPVHKEEESASGDLLADDTNIISEDERELTSLQNGKKSKDERGMNPQDGTLHPAPLHAERIGRVAADFAVTVHDDNSSKEGSLSVAASSPSVASSEQSSPRLPVLNEESSSPKSRRKPKRLLIQGRNRGRSRVAPIDAGEAKTKGLPAPSNQYECILIRRAVLPVDPNKTQSPEVVVDVDGEADRGDISLGMKLSIADTGHVIVQRVTPLADGRASPAQLTGMIQRGDILLSIDGVSLTENALAGLTPLRAPEDPTVPCQRQYKLRFAAGEGLEMLRSIENRQTRAGSNSAGNVASEMLALFPMVDQLSGMPLFEEQHNQENQSPSVATTSEAPKEIEIAQTEPSPPKKKSAVPLDDQISESLAALRVTDRNQYFLGDDRGEMGQHGTGSVTEQLLLTLPQRQALGRKAIVGARNLIQQVENIDAGKDIRSFQSWNTTLSLYSRASTRRRRVFDAASLPLQNFGRVEEDKNEDDDRSVVSDKSSTNSEKLDGDELLLRLAAHDEIWRKQVIEFLEKVAQESEDPGAPEEKAPESSNSDINEALSNELGSFLFGENMTKILAKHRTPRTLPSEEVTAVLFDLATKLSASVPDEIKASGTVLSSKSSLTPFTGLKRHAAGSDVVLATRFLLDGALPAWLKSFRPLAWEQRRILWPVDKIHGAGGASLASSLSDDSFTVDTTNASLQSTPTRQRKRKKNIQEIIEDQELNIETRGETCFLTTFYFINALLPRLMLNNQGDGLEKALDEIVVFLGEYGAYLRMDTSLAYAAVLKADTVVDLLLNIAKHDPRHREVIKQTAKSSAMVFYEPTMLSAVLQLLRGIQKEITLERKQAIIDLCASAYPDVRPWQVERACRFSSQGKTSSSDGVNDLYYTYLSLLLHPVDGHDTARRDPSLVKEWCERSVKDIETNGSNGKSDRRSNFFSVASRASSHHLVYHRDLVFLLTLSMEIKEYGLALDLAGEILDDPRLSMRQDTLDLVLNQLRLVGINAVDADDDGKQIAAWSLKRIVRLYSKPSCRQFVDVPAELMRLIQHCAGEMTSTGITSKPKALELIHFFAEEAIPGDMLNALALCDSLPSFQPELLPVLHKILARGASTGRELSASLLRIKRARRRLAHLSTTNTSGMKSDYIPSATDDQCSELSVWQSMATGILAVDK